MKIRTSFVTNSSGRSSSRIKIENKELYKLLEEYTKEINDRLKDISDETIKITNLENGIIDDYGCYDECERKEIFCNRQKIDNIVDVGNAYINALDKSIKGCRQDEIVDKIFDELKRELDEKQELINSEYSNITMSSSYSGDAGYYDDEDVIDSRNKCPLCGGQVVYSYSKSDDFKNFKSSTRLYCNNSFCGYFIELENTNKQVDDDWYDCDEPFSDFIDTVEIDDDLPF